LEEENEIRTTALVGIDRISSSCSRSLLSFFFLLGWQGQGLSRWASASDEKVLSFPFSC